MTRKRDAEAVRAEWRASARKLAEVDPLSVEAEVLLVGMTALREEQERLADHKDGDQSEPLPSD